MAIRTAGTVRILGGMVSSSWHLNASQYKNQKNDCGQTYQQYTICIIVHHITSYTSYTSCTSYASYVTITINMHQYASICINMHQYASICINMHQYASITIISHLRPGHELLKNWALDAGTTSQMHQQFAQQRMRSNGCVATDGHWVQSFQSMCRQVLMPTLWTPKKRAPIKERRYAMHCYAMLRVFQVVQVKVLSGYHIIYIIYIYIYIMIYHMLWNMASGF